MASAVVMNYLKTSYNLAVFQEPRGVMRLFQLFFSICVVFFSDFSVGLTVACSEKGKSGIYQFDYPFKIYTKYCNNTEFISLDVSSDARFFMITGILSILYAITIILVYMYFDDIYKRKPEFPMADFALTLILAIFWLSGSSAWSNGSSALKTSLENASCSNCQVYNTGFSGLNISLVLGYLNFFLWGSDLWFLYKETIWFQQRMPQQPMQPEI